MRYDDTRAAFDCLRNCVQGVMLKSEQKLRDELKVRLDMLLEPAKYAPHNPNGFAPIRGYNLDNLSKSKAKSHWSFKKPSATRAAKPPPAPMSADDILASI